jgi:putative ABC transport system permease protein
MQGLLQHLRYTARLLLKAPGFTVTAILILGFGIGVNTTIFSLIETVLLKPLSFHKADRLVQIHMPNHNGSWGQLDYPDYLEICRAQQSFVSLAVQHGDFLDLSGTEHAERLNVDYVSSSMFEVTGKPFVLGRPFTAKEDLPNGPLLAVLSDRFWKNRFNSDPNIIGKNITLSDQSFQVIGVVPAQVDDWGPPPTDIYLPINNITVFGYYLNKRESHWVECYGRLKDGVNVANAQQEFNVILSDLVARYPDTDKGYSLLVVPALDSMVQNYSTTIWLLAAAVGCLLLISIANVANLLFARAVARRKEMSVRAALGASRFRLIGQLLAETTCLSFLGGVVGLFIALWAIEAIKALSPQDIYRFQEVHLDITALLFVIGVTTLVALLAGFLPAWSLSKANLGQALKEDGSRANTTGSDRRHLQATLVIGQVALACTLLIGAELITRSLQAIQNVPLGFNPGHLLTAELTLTSTKYELDAGRTRGFWDAVLEKVRQLPEVVEAAMNDNLPFDYDYGWPDPFHVVGQADPVTGEEPSLGYHMISPNYFHTLEIPLLKGRDFDARDKVENQRVTIIDEELAKTYFANQDPLGRQIQIKAPDGTHICTIVGVVPHVNQNSPDFKETPFQAYFPYTQQEWDFEVLVLRSRGDPNQLISELRKTIASVDPGVPVGRVSTYDDLVVRKFVTRKLGVLLINLFSSAAVFLSAVGLYGILAYTVSQRTPEIGIRIAFGAQPSNILGLVVSQGLRLVCFGLIIGIVATLVLVRFIDSILYGVSPADPILLGIAVLILGTTAFVACLMPAIRALKIDPATALRH